MPRYPPGSIRVGSIAGIAILVRASWIWIALLLAWVLAPRIEAVEPGLGNWKYVGGLAYAVLLYATILLHEFSHALMARHYGLPVRWISLHFLGGATEIEGEPRTPREEFNVAVVGPLTSLVVGGIAWAASTQINQGLLYLVVVLLAFTNIVLGVLNLVPGLPLDGGRVLRALVWRGTSSPHRGTVVAAWGGRVCALLALCWPLLVLPLIFNVTPSIIDFLLAGLVAGFLWMGASASLHNARVRSRLPLLKARTLARPVLAVPGDLPLAEAVRQAQEAGSGALVTHAGDGRVTGIVSESALDAVPEDRRPWVPVSSVARSFDDGLVVPADTDGEQLLMALGRVPASEYLLVEPDGSIFGVLAATDVDHAFRTTMRG